MANLAVTNTLSNGATILASEHNTNYSDIVTYINNRNTGSSTWDAISVLSSSVVPLVINNSTGTQDIARFQDNGSNVVQVFDGGIITFASQSGARAYRNTSTLSLSGDTKVEFNAETFDLQSEFDASTNFRFTATKDGKYFVSSTLHIDSPASAPVIHIYVNGSSFVKSTSPGTTTNIAHSISHVLNLTATDYVEIFVNAGASGSVTNGSDTSYVSIHKIA